MSISLEHVYRRKTPENFRSRVKRLFKSKTSEQEAASYIRQSERNEELCDASTWSRIRPYAAPDMHRMFQEAATRETLEKSLQRGWNRAEAYLSDRQDPNGIAIFDHGIGKSRFIRVSDISVAYEDDPAELQPLMFSYDGPESYEDYLYHCERFLTRAKENDDYVVGLVPSEGNMWSGKLTRQRFPVQGMLHQVVDAHIIGASLYAEKHQR